MIDLSTEKIAELAFREVSRLTREAVTESQLLKKQLRELDYNNQFFY